MYTLQWEAQYPLRMRLAKLMLTWGICLLLLMHWKNLLQIMKVVYIQLPEGAQSFFVIFFIRELTTHTLE